MMYIIIIHIPFLYLVRHIDIRVFNLGILLIIWVTFYTVESVYTFSSKCAIRLIHTWQVTESCLRIWFSSLKRQIILCAKHSFLIYHAIFYKSRYCYLDLTIQHHFDTDIWHLCIVKSVNNGSILNASFK